MPVSKISKELDVAIAVAELGVLAEITGDLAGFVVKVQAAALLQVAEMLF